MFHGAVDFAAERHHRILDDPPFADIGGRRERIAGVNFPGFVVDVERGRIAEKIHVRLPEGGDRPDVLPVAFEQVGEHLFPRREHGGQHVFAEIFGGIGICVVLFEIFEELFRGKNIDAHGCERALRHLGLFFELIDGAVRIGVENPESGRFGKRHVDRGDRAVRPLVDVRLQHGGVIHFVDVVAREDQNVIGIIHFHEMHILIDRVCRALVPGRARLALVRREDVHAAERPVEIPRLSVADVLVEDERLVLREDADRIDPRIDAVGEREIDDAVLGAEGDRGFCDVAGERKKPAALAAREKHGDTFFFSLHRYTPGL